MKRKMIGITAGYLSGLFFVSFFTDIWKLIIPFSAFLIYVVIGKLKGFSVNDFAIVSMSFAVAFTAGELYTRYVYEDILSYADVTGSFSGTVSDYDIYDNDKHNKKIFQSNWIIKCPKKNKKFCTNYVPLVKKKSQNIWKCLLIKYLLPQIRSKKQVILLNYLRLL